jgi:hypothetical protein
MDGMSLPFYNGLLANILHLTPAHPQASLLGLWLGCLLGLALGMGLAVLWSRADPRQDTSQSESKRAATTGAGIALIGIGLVVFWLPYWFMPLIYVSGGH